MQRPLTFGGGCIQGLCGAKAPHATSPFFLYIYIVKNVIAILVLECVINSI